MNLRSPLGDVLGYGSAKEGTDHWWMQRVSAVGLVVLGLWFLIATMRLDGFDQATVRAWISEPWNSVLLILLGLALSYHSKLGLQVVIEDYVHGPFLKVVSLLANKFFHIVVATAATVAVLRIAFA